MSPSRSEAQVARPLDHAADRGAAIESAAEKARTVLSRALGKVTIDDAFRAEIESAEQALWDALRLQAHGLLMERADPVCIKCHRCGVGNCDALAAEVHAKWCGR